MANEQHKNPTTGHESDISKSQSQQRPPEQAKQQPESGELRSELETGQAEAGRPDEGLRGETLTEQRTDIEGASLQSEKGEAESGFVGAEGEKDTSGEFVEKKDEDRQGFTPEGK